MCINVHSAGYVIAISTAPAVEPAIMDLNALGFFFFSVVGALVTSVVFTAAAIVTSLALFPDLQVYYTKGSDTPNTAQLDRVSAS